ncbi:MAG: amino acid ABC transporter permease [Clostridia bacterium]|nr:amino acid ABC transporter permease [Clostridia bacterium]MBQ7316135.1 amino acid ABC transporter permease [Clostridia bacterium]
MEQFWKITLDLCVGFGETLKIFFITLAMALPLGLIISFGSMSKFKPLAFLTRGFVWIIRGTPLMLQLITVYYGPGLVFKQMLFTAPMAVYITFTINYACYFSEIYRGGIESITKGQYEAGQVLGMTRRETFFKVILLQVVKRIIAPMSNEIITLVKDTSLARVVTYYELIYFAQRYTKNAGLLWPLFYTAVYYLVFTAILTLLFRWLEKKLDYFKA